MRALCSGVCPVVGTGHNQDLQRGSAQTSRTRCQNGRPRYRGLSYAAIFGASAWYRDFGCVVPPAGVGHRQKQLWIVIAPQHAKSRAVSQQQGRLAPPLTMRAGGHYIVQH